MDIIALAGVVGTVCSIVTFFIPDKVKSGRITMSLIVFAVVALSAGIVHLNSKLTRIRKTSRAALELSNRKRTGDFTYEGYIQAGLAFMEQNKDAYPDSYNRAESIFDRYKSLDRSDGRVVDLSYEMDGLLKGIATLTREE